MALPSPCECILSNPNESFDILFRPAKEFIPFCFLFKCPPIFGGKLKNINEPAPKIKKVSPDESAIEGNRISHMPAGGLKSTRQI